MALRPTFKRKWLRALRSGNYTQEPGALRRRVMPRSSKFSYCCLGVALDVLGAKWTKNECGNYVCKVGRVENDDTGSLLTEVLDRIGMTEHQQQTLIRMNDSDGRTFEQIADFVEGNL